MLYIMRHGKTDWNAKHKLQGHADIPLNEEGRQMAEKAREEYDGPVFDVCYCSPLVRAKETAEIFLKGTHTPIIADPRLIEMSFCLLYTSCKQKNGSWSTGNSSYDTYFGRKFCNGTTVGGLLYLEMYKKRKEKIIRCV